MHGKILRYSISTGSGVVTNASKKIFELRKESWHDTRFLPVVGMFVEFRCDTNGYSITDAKASYYQEFPLNGIIKENDFWKTNTDEELKQKEQDTRNQMVQKIFKETNYFALKTIETTSSIQDCLKEYFAQEFNAIKFILDENDSSGTSKINYLLTKRFLLKAMDYLVFTDRNITMDTFANDLQRLNQLEYSYKNFTKNINLNIEKIYEDCFLESQYNYRGTIKAILGTKEKILQLNNKIKNSIYEIKQIKAKLENKKNDEKSLNIKLENIRFIIAKSEEEIKILNKTLENLTALTDGFKNQHLKIFEVVFKKFYEILVNKTKEAMDICATSLDDKIWKLGMSSTAIKNMFFKHDINDSYCTMTFLGQYLRRLDKNKLSENERVVYNYYFKYKQSHEKKFLIFTTNQKLEMSLKIQIMSISKNYSVVIVKKDGEFYSNINRQKFELGYIDPYIDIDTKQLIEEARNSKYNHDTKFSIVTKEQIAAIKD
ncbi:hypothetical protein BKH41_01090 [Helicobacter sp. 12S02232-10]|uniref:hypothetical protein n=1 Tax=Helicobacter sp. 12S02232-10 TaxID=1476197 RepID=UPI000BA79989|nr:hypothetical protein [Helicobacter sp. 12S02232-10]PAF49927.1 hypothetical protein BKH41_01090 [Helicobacter sp. 12S02232-10]